MKVSTLILSYVDDTGKVHLTKIPDASFDIPSFNKKMDTLFDKLITAFKKHQINDLRLSIKDHTLPAQLDIW